MDDILSMANTDFKAMSIPFSISQKTKKDRYKFFFFLLPRVFVSAEDDLSALRSLFVDASEESRDFFLSIAFFLLFFRSIGDRPYVGKGH